MGVWVCSLAVVWLLFGGQVTDALTAAFGLDIPVPQATEHLMF